MPFPFLSYILRRDIAVFLCDVCAQTEVFIHYFYKQPSKTMRSHQPQVHSPPLCKQTATFKKARLRMGTTDNLVWFDFFKDIQYGKYQL